MPAYGDRSAPSFDESKPRELSRFFDELERLFTRDPALTEAQKKNDLLRYASFDTAQAWKRFPAYKSATGTYIEFRDEIYERYPDSTGESEYTLRDKEEHIQLWRDSGIHSTDELTTFHVRFESITSFLIEKDAMGEHEQRRDYMRAFTQPLLGEIKSFLRVKSMKSLTPNMAHKIKDVYEAARYALMDEDLYPPGGTGAIRPVPVAAKAAPATGYLKTETFTSFMTDFSKTIADALQQSGRSRITGPTGPSTTAVRNTDCNFCGGAHFIRECKLVEEYCTAGKCRRNFEGKVVLSTGAFVPRDIPGTLLRERVDEWHHRNPGQLSVASLVHTISAEHVRTHSETPVQSSFQLSSDDRIIALEAELFNLRARRPAFVPLARTRGQKAREAALPSIEEVEEEEEATAAPTINKIPEIVITPVRQPQKTREPEAPFAALPFEPPEHPFRDAQDAAYAPPTARVVGAPVKVPAAKGLVPAYKTQPPVHDYSIATDVYNRAMEASITITQRELLSLSPEVRSQVREVSTARRMPVAAGGVPQASLHVRFTDDDPVYDTAPAFALNRTEETVPPKGAFIVEDPIEHYYESLEPGEMPSLDRLTVAKESTAIRSVYALIDTQQKKECTVDPGCQVIAMSETTCHSLGLSYDPRIRLNMESANGTFDWSLGLARNVAFHIGTITLYLQAHVIRSPSYEVLLGRPFDVLTESVIRNFNNEDQTITITDPNTGNKCTIPTFARGTRNVNTLAPLDF